jgi:hypothetical protein
MNPEWRDLFDKATGELCFGSADTEATAELISHVSGPGFGLPKNDVTPAKAGVQTRWKLEQHL